MKNGNTNQATSREINPKINETLECLSIDLEKAQVDNIYNGIIKEYLNPVCDYGMLLFHDRPLTDIVEYSGDNLLCTWFADTSGLTPGQKVLNRKLLNIITVLSFQFDTVELKKFLAKNENNQDLKTVLDLERGESGLTILHALASMDWTNFNYGDALGLLIEAGADPNKKNDKGKTPLHYATGHNSVDSLLKAGANPNAQDIEGKTPLHYIAGFNCHVGVVDLLLKKGADPAIRDKQGKTPLHCAIHSSEIDPLLKAGANPNAQDIEGKTPLHYIVVDDCDGRSTDFLLKKDADPAIRDKQGKTPLDIAIDNHQYHIRKYFLTNNQRKLSKELYSIVDRYNGDNLDNVIKDLKEFLDKQDKQDLKVVLNIQDNLGRSEILKHVKHTCRNNDRLRNLFLEAGATDFRDHKEFSLKYKPKSSTLWGKLISSQRVKQDEFLGKVSRAQNMDQLEKVVTQAIKSGIRFNFSKQFFQNENTFQVCNFTDLVIEKIGNLEKNPKVASSIICKLVSRGAILHRGLGMAVIDELESEFEGHKINMTRAYMDHVNRTSKFMKIAKSAATGELKDAKLDNSTLYVEYSGDSIINVAKITDGARDLGLTNGEIRCERKVIKFDKNEIEVIEERGVRNYTDLADGSDVVLIFYTTQGELKVRLYPDKKDKNLIMVEVKVGYQEKWERLKNCKEEIGENCQLGGLSVNEAIGKGSFVRSGKLMRSEVISPSKKISEEVKVAVEGLKPGDMNPSSSLSCPIQVSIQQIRSPGGEPKIV